jgi:hypothetical protein
MSAMSNVPGQQDEREFIRNPVRVFLRVFGAVMFIAGAVIAGVFAVLGPTEMAQSMGRSCAHNPNGAIRNSEQCTILDAIELAAAAPILLLVGAVLVLALKRSSVRSGGPAAPVWTPVAPKPPRWQRVVAALYTRR